MAIHAHSTPMPAPQRGLLRLVPDLASAEVVDLVEATDPVSARFGDNPDIAAVLHDGMRTHMCTVSRGHMPTGDVPHGVAAALLPPEPEPDTAPLARALHMRRELRKGLDHGLALMDALDLSPRGLDLMDRAIAQLDAPEAPDEDLEPWLAGYQNLAAMPLDAEDDSEEDEGTSLETFGRGFVRCGADDAEDDDPAERDEEHGSEDEAHPWQCDPSLVAFAVQVTHG